MIRTTLSCNPRALARFIPASLALVVATVLSCGDASSQESVPDPFAKWEKDIAAFEAQDAATPPPSGQVLFVGSSSIRGWDLKESFPELAALNRGFGGSEVADTLHFAGRIVIPYRPKQVFLYAGDNDISNGKDAHDVFEDFARLAELIETRLPGTELVFIAIKPSISRWKLWPEMRRANDMVAGYARAKAHVKFADIAPVTLGSDGEPDPALFKEDGLHLNAAGYKAWAGVITAFLKN